MTSRTSRRMFLKQAALTGAAAAFAPAIVHAQNLGKDKLRIAFVGTGGQAGAHIGLAEQESCPCYCDVDKGRWDKIAKMAPNAKAYTDYRKMFDNHMKEIDAVVVTVPDHSHAAASMYALKNGKHCYTEKPLTWSIEEARILAETAAKQKVATQMGNMGHANEGNRIVVEYVRSGILGDIKEVHTWTNRPVWPQGIAKRPPTEAVPANLDWDCWIGPAPFRDYHKHLHSFDWRGWFDFGCGAVGDMGCHTWDCVFWSMDPDYPSTVELVKIEGRNTETFPTRCCFKWSFPAKGNRPGFEAYWYEGGMKPEVPEEILKDASRDNKNLPGSGSLFIGTKGKLLVGGDYADSPSLIPESFRRQVGKPPRLLERSPGHKPEWLQACKGLKPWNSPGSNFATYAGPITEVMLLGAITQKIGEVGFKIECDPVKRVIKTKEALAFYGRQYRKGWTL
ncbi:MAG: Gfo/Idh/MocA family protein [Bacillota bacterium]